MNQPQSYVKRRQWDYSGCYIIMQFSDIASISGTYGFALIIVNSLPIYNWQFDAGQ